MDRQAGGGGERQGRLVHLQGVGLDHGQPAGRRRAEVRPAAGRKRGSTLHGDDLRGRLSSRGAGQAAGAGADLDRGSDSSPPARRAILRVMLRSSEEVLAEALLGQQPVLGARLSRSGGRSASSWLSATPRRAAHVRAMRMAAIRLSARPRPRPAMS
jgi:hypothetical protein